MSVLELFWHLAGFVAPALGVALAVTLAGRRWAGASRLTLPWQLALNVGVGVAVLLVGLVLLGQDGRMLTYAALVLAAGSCQWLLTLG